MRRKGDVACRRPEESCSTKDLLQPEEGTAAGRGPFSACQPRVWTLTRYLELLKLFFIIAYSSCALGEGVTFFALHIVNHTNKKDILTLLFVCFVQFSTLLTAKNKGI